MSTPHKTDRTVLQQLDFWPELRHPGMAFYAAMAGSGAPARSASEDGRTAAGSAATAKRAPLGIYGENDVTSTPKPGGKR